ncbi:hypothetical protein F52700_9673 [Fusarium sp. NRRL 52700]|nr:hypothetical protein F52700_9673 [Fusarium sp. NRRL 52700]
MSRFCSSTAWGAKLRENGAGNYDCMGAVAYVIKSKVHRKKIEQMEARFKNDRQELQIILQSEILSQTEAIQYLATEEFENLEADIKTLISQLSQGFSKLEDFIKAQNEATNKIIESRLDATDNLIVHGVAEVQQGIKEHFTTAQRNDFLDSFRYPEIKIRYNDVLDSSEANFDRVFASYEKITTQDQKSVLSKDDSNQSSSEASDSDFPNIDSDELRTINKSWSNFVDWLKSSDSLFCIQGKPGSGKSTLIKFVIDNENTQRLLQHQSPDIIIMSHFSWKIGSREQSSIKGFLCSLIYQLLACSERLQELPMGLYDTGSHKSYHDWSPRSLKILLRQILEIKSHAVCVFVDGLDEVANDDGLDKLTREIEEILQFPGIKICISSRPEASVVKWLERLNTPSIRLEDLTRPEMSSYVHQGLDPLLSSKKLSVEAHQYLCDEMVPKSQGVFLWLDLVLRSLIDGIQNGDTEKILVKRLAELPGKIHDLYTDIWDRLNERNPVYRRDAVRYVLCVLRNKWWPVYFGRSEHSRKQQFTIRQPFLGQIAFAEMPDRHGSLLKHGDRIDFKEVHEACNMTKKQIEIRCGGLLQVRMQENGEGIPLDIINNLVMQKVGFIHRTAHDFFTETELGWSILQADSAAAFQLEISACLVKGLLCLHRIIAHQHGVSAEMIFIIAQVGRLSYERHHASVLAQMIEMLPVLQSFFAENIISANLDQYPKCHFLTYLVPYISFHEFIKFEIGKASSARLATQILQELCCEMGMFVGIDRLVPVELIGPLTSMGANAHACILDPRELQGRKSYKDGNAATMVSEVVTSMSMTCPDLNNTTLIVFRMLDSGRIVSEGDKIKVNREEKHASIFVEAKLSFLVVYLFSQLKLFIEESAASKGLPGNLESPRPEIRFILARDEQLDSWICHRISSQQSCEKLIDFLFPQEGPPAHANERVWNNSIQTQKRFDRISALLKHLDVVPYDFESEMLSMAADNLGVHNFQEAGIIPYFHGVKEMQEARAHASIKGLI